MKIFYVSPTFSIGFPLKIFLVLWAFIIENMSNYGVEKSLNSYIFGYTAAIIHSTMLCHISNWRFFMYLQLSSLVFLSRYYNFWFFSQNLTKKFQIWNPEVLTKITRACAGHPWAPWKVSQSRVRHCSYPQYSSCWVIQGHTLLLILVSASS